MRRLPAGAVGCSSVAVTVLVAPRRRRPSLVANLPVAAMTMTPRLRKFALTAHVTSSVGWLGAVAVFLALAVAGLTSQDAQTVRAAYLAMELTGWFVLVPLSLASLLTGLVQSLGTAWGLFRHYWVLFKLLINVVATIVLLLYMQTARLRRRCRGRDESVQWRSRRAAEPISVLHAGARPAGVARGHDAVGVQAEGPDPVRMAQAARAAGPGAACNTRRPSSRSDGPLIPGKRSAPRPATAMILW